MELNQQLLLLPTDQLLDKFGAGNHVPGSGSAAALSGILACKLCLAVAKLTRTKPNYSDVSSQMSYIMKKIENLEPKLRTAFQRDSEVFNEVILLRRERDNEINKKNKRTLSSQETRKLREATDIPLDICKICHEVCQQAIYLFDVGFKSARGDSGAAASSALSGAYAALFVCFLNLKRFRESRWTIKTREKCNELLIRTNELQRELFSRVIKLRDEGIPQSAIQLQLELK